MARPEQLRAEDTVRTLSAAANAVRLYPPTSLLPAQAVDRFLAVAAAETSSLQLTVEPGGFKYGDTPLAEGQTNVVAFAESLYAHQAGKLIVAPGATAPEVMEFLRCTASDPPAVKDAGGVRAVLKRAGVTHLAVIEVTLRPSTEEGLAGLDLTAAPLDEIAPCLVAAAYAWQESAAGGPGDDGIARSIGGLEEAARDLAAQRVAEALMRLDEVTRARALAAAYATDANGQPMAGMLDVVARMKPAALARLLMLAAGQGTAPANELLAGLRLPPEALRAVMLLLKPSPMPEEACGVMGEPNVSLLAAEAVAETEADAAELERQISASSRPAAAKALRTTVELATQRRTAEAVEAIGDALGPAIRSGSLASVRTALGYLGSLVSDPQLGAAAAAARHALADTDLLRACIRSLADGADPDVVASILSAAGSVGADAFIAFYLDADETARPRLQQVLRSMGDVVTTAASKRIREADAHGAQELIGVLAGVGDKRTVPVLRQALEHLDIAVREACLAALGQMYSPDAERLLVSALNHWDPETRRLAAREIGKAHAMSAVPAMLKILQGYYLFERNYGLKKELIESLEVLGSPTAVPTLRRMARRRFVVGRKNRELRYLARRALDGIEQARNVEGRAS